MTRARSMRVLITAGPTREYLDPVRFLSNDSSGTMGFALARAAVRRGHRVTLVHGPVALRPPPGARAIPVTSAAQMRAACLAAWPQHDALIMAAAVADYTPTKPSRRKLKRLAAELAVRLKPTTDILAELSRRRRPGQRVIGFALEDRAVRLNAARKLRDKRLDAIVLNRPAAIAAARCELEWLAAGGTWRVLPEASKARQAAQIVRLLEGLRPRGK